MKKFEYRLLEINNGFFSGVDYKELNDQLNQLGMLGWELVSTVSITSSDGQTSNLLITLKRERLG